MSKPMTWVDLSSTGIYLSVMRDAEQRAGLVLLDESGRHGDVIGRMGFAELDEPLSRGVYWRVSTGFTMAELQGAFGAPVVRVVQRPLEQIRADFSERLAENTKRNANEIFKQQRPIGFNHLGEIVQESHIGRYILQRESGQFRFVRERSADPARFMRADDASQLALIARGFVSRITERGESLRRDHVDKLIAASNRADFDRKRYEEAIEVAVGELFASKAEALVGSGSDLMALFDIANAIYQGAPDLRSRTASSMANQQYSTPLPLAAAAQALLGLRGDLVGRTVLDPTVGNGATVRALKAAGALVYGVEIDEARADAVRSAVDGIVEADATQVDFAGLFNMRAGFDFVISNPPFGRVEKSMVPLRSGGDIVRLEVARLDYKIALAALAARSNVGRAVFILAGDNVLGDGHIKGRSQHFYNYVFDHYQVDGLVEISGELYKKQGADFPVRLLVLGERLADPVQAAAPTVIPVIRTYEGLREWTASVIDATVGATRDVDQLLEQSLAEVLDDEGPSVDVAAPDFRVENAFQQKYVAFSNVGEPSTMIPANLSGPVYEALAKIKEKHGDIDGFVAARLQFDVADLGDMFLPEQIDALAMILDAQSRGLGFLLADQPGVGKGRVIAGVARHERLEGRVPMFITLSDNLFTDFLERDLVQIRSRDLFKNPFIVNDGARTVNEANEVVVKSLGRKRYLEHAQAERLPEGTDLVMLTYSQLNRSPEASVTSKFMRAVTSKYPISLLLDESHAGAGTSNTSLNLEAMVLETNNVLYSSGTPIKGAKNLRLYRKILPSAVDADEILEVVESDPLSMQEALNYEIAAQGCLISREREATGLAKEYLKPRDERRNHAIADQMSEVLAAMSFLAGDVKKIVGQMDAAFEAALAQVPESEREGARMHASSMNFGSRLHQITRQMLLALKAPDVAAEALRTLAANKKPIIALQHTGESLLRDFVEANHVESSGDGLILARPVTFKDLMERYVERILTIKVVGRYGEETKKQADSDQIRVATSKLRELIAALPNDLPLTPIDYIRERLAAEGYSMGEISGRSLRATTLPDGRMLVEPMPELGDRTRVNRTIRGFNGGQVDVLVLTASGSTGLSVQASPALGADVRPRRMIKWEMQANITDERQIDMRHNRTGQVVAPEYAIPLSGLVADDRLAMQFNNKNRSLTSSTVANRDSKDLIRDVPDLLNPVGDEVALQLLYQRPDIARRLDIELSEDEYLHNRSHKALGNIGKLTGRISLLKVAEQESLYAELQSRFIELLDRLKAEGRNPLEVDCHEWQARVVSREVYMGDERNGDANRRSQIGAPVYLTELEYQVPQKAVRSSTVDRSVARAAAVSVATPEIVQYLKASRTDILAKHLGKKFKTVPDALAAQEPNEVKIAAAKVDWLERNLPLLKAGAVFVERDLEGREVPKVISAVSVPSRADSFMRLSDYAVNVMEPGSDVSSWRSLSPLFAGGIELGQEDFAKDLHARAAFDSAEDGFVARRVRVLDGNLFDATSLNLRSKIGQKIVYTDESGARQHGILIRADVTRDALESIPERVTDPDLMSAIVCAGGVVTTVLSAGKPDPKRCVRFSGDRTKGFKLAVPAVKYLGAEIYLDPVLSRIKGKEGENRFGLNFAQSGNSMVALLRESELAEVMAYVAFNKGQKLYVEDRKLLAKVRAERSKEVNSEAAVGLATAV
jgi:pyruvoyl-dependent arginine decarboxylase (PvlArgDC)